MLFGRPPDIEALKRGRDVAGLVKALANRSELISAGAAAALGEVAPIILDERHERRTPREEVS